MYTYVYLIILVKRAGSGQLFSVGDLGVGDLLINVVLMLLVDIIDPGNELVDHLGADPVAHALLDVDDLQLVVVASGPALSVGCRHEPVLAPAQGENSEARVVLEFASLVEVLQVLDNRQWQQCVRGRGCGVAVFHEAGELRAADQGRNAGVEILAEGALRTNCCPPADVSTEGDAAHDPQQVARGGHLLELGEVRGQVARDQLDLRRPELHTARHVLGVVGVADGPVLVGELVHGSGSVVGQVESGTHDVGQLVEDLIGQDVGSCVVLSAAMAEYGQNHGFRRVNLVDTEHICLDSGDDLDLRVLLGDALANLEFPCHLGRWRKGRGRVAMRDTGDTTMAGKTLLVTTGATVPFDELLLQFTPDLLAGLRQQGFDRFVFQCGKSRAAEQLPQARDISKFEFTTDLAARIAQADLVVAPAGAGTILDVLRAPTRPKLVVCINSKLMNNHQLEIARKLAPEILLMCEPATVACTLLAAADQQFSPLPPPESAQKVIDELL